MRVFTYSEARRRLSEVLDLAQKEAVIIKRRAGESFSVRYRPSERSPLDVPGVKTKATTEDILAAVKESRERG